MKNKKIVLEYSFSDDVILALDEFLEMLVELDAFVANVTFKKQLGELERLPNDKQLQVIEKTVIRGWRSLAYAIDEVKQGKHISGGDTSVSVPDNSSDDVGDKSDEVWF